VSRAEHCYAGRMLGQGDHKAGCSCGWTDSRHWVFEASAWESWLAHVQNRFNRTKGVTGVVIES
jgi:hypothetical protein